ncbi:hypothetical protein CEUSTIGMA_g8655.t1 [Chlamydomonas eustigma]|uniref:Uncharacterized protein n=1 Tax=Chlamydomonas eustigma TaxID=1157962 RepID=A0A250XDP9_9CHLO|nr:hypothetical protein CEUSTIGMA_g8655.t1 [Chlamydomonas eustigma]|eukprot:GAX81223.1 hypothetical protein CEUSTIGMA_g8655.t1 [Chlamydomonas eustigma]
MTRFLLFLRNFYNLLSCLLLTLRLLFLGELADAAVLPASTNSSFAGSNLADNFTVLSALSARRRSLIDVEKWCPHGSEAHLYGCNLLGYVPKDIPEKITTPISMIGGLGGSPGSVSYCELSAGDMVYATQIVVYNDHTAHENLHYVDQITVQWSNGDVSRIGSCSRHGVKEDCENAIQDKSGRHLIDLSGSNVVKSYAMAVDGYYSRNVGQPGQLLGWLLMNIQTPSGPQDQGYVSCCAGDGYSFTSPKSIGSGMVCGITYRSDASVDAFGLVFYNAVTRVNQMITNTPVNATALLNVTQQAAGTCATGAGYNFGTSNVAVGQSSQVTTTYTITNSWATSLKLGAKLSYEQSVIFMSAKAEFSLEVSETQTHQSSWGEAKTIGNTYTTTQTVNQICPTYINACGYAPETPLQPGDCCQWYTTQSYVKADAATWTGVLIITFKAADGSQYNRTIPTSGTASYLAYASNTRSAYLCQRLPSYLSNCNQLPAWTPLMMNCNAN